MRNLLRPLMLFILLLTAVPTTTSKAADPRKPGPYAVGVRTEVFVDADRTCAVTGKPRTLVTEIWYPATKEAGDEKTNKYSDFWGRPAGLAAGGMAIGLFGGQFQRLNESFKNVARRDAKALDGSFPLLIFSHGNGGLRHQNTFQTEYLASHGYIVAAPDHTGNAAVTVLPDQIVPYAKLTRGPERRDDRPHDLSFLISHLSELSAAKDHWLAGRIVSDQVGALGHSFGGFTVSRVTELDPRVNAILPMTLAGTLQEDGAKQAPCAVPMLVILGDADRTVGQRGNDHSTAYFEAATGPKYLLNFKDAGHYTFTEMTQINPAWGDGLGVDKDDDGNVTFTYSDALEDQRITNEYSTAFFDAFLKQDAAAKTFLDENHYPKELAYR